MIKNKILVLSFVVIMLFVCLGLTGCNRNPEIYEDGYYQYFLVGENDRNYKNKNDAVVAIIGLTELGQKQEVIDFPRTIGGNKVRFIGYRDFSTFTTSYFYITSPNLKKAYVHHNISKTIVIGGVHEESININFNGDLMMCAASDNALGLHSGDFQNIYIYRPLYEVSKPINLRPANITFLYNYTNAENEGYYRLDNIETGEQIPEPPIPEREGYEFTGWFTEAEQINSWNFDSTLEVEEDTDFKLHAGWRSE